MPETHLGSIRLCLYCEKKHRAWSKAAFKCQDRYERRFDEIEDLERDAEVRGEQIRRLSYLVMIGYDFINHWEIEDVD